MCLHIERECCVRVLGNQLRVDKREGERRRVQMVHTSVALKCRHCGFPHTANRDAAKTNRFELASGEMRCENHVMESKRESSGNKCWCKT